MDTPIESISSSSTSTALVRKRPSDMELMPPPPVVKKIKRPKTVLDEETYIDCLSEIIKRDFFPELAEIQTQQEYLNAIASNDKGWISSTRKRLRELMTPSANRRRGRTLAIDKTPTGPTPKATPSTQRADTPASYVSSNVPTLLDMGPGVDTDVSLTEYQEKHTSEDNESFYRLLDQQNIKRAQKYAWAYNLNKLPSKQMVAQNKAEVKLALTRSLVDDGYRKDRLAIMDRDERPAQPDTWVHTAKNNLMFIPNGVDGEMETPAQRAQADSRMAPKSIVYANTQMPRPNPPAPPPSSPTLSAVRAAVAGEPRESDLTSTACGGETPRVNGYAYVDDEDDDGDDDLAQINFGPADPTPNPFKIAESRRREKLLHHMVDKMAESKRVASRNGMTGRVMASTPVPSFPNSPRVSAGSLTPAARRLWNRLGTSASSASGAFGASRTPVARSRTGGMSSGRRKGR